MQTGAVGRLCWSTQRRPELSLEGFGGVTVQKQQYMSVLERTTDFEKISDIGPVDERHVASEKHIVGESAVFYPLTQLSRV